MEFIQDGSLSGREVNLQPQQESKVVLSINSAVITLKNEQTWSAIISFYFGIRVQQLILYHT